MELLTGHRRHVRGDAALAVDLCELQRRAQLEERVAAEERAHEDAVGFEGFSDLHEDPWCGSGAV